MRTGSIFAPDENEKGKYEFSSQPTLIDLVKILKFLNLKLY